MEITILDDPEFLTLRLEREGCNHVRAFCLPHHSLAVALRNPVRRRAAPLRDCPDQGRRREGRERGRPHLLGPAWTMLRVGWVSR